MDFEERRPQFLKILPVTTRKDLSRQLTDFADLEAIAEWVRVRIELGVQCGRDDNDRWRVC